MPRTPGRVAVISQGGTPAYVRDGKVYDGGIFGGDLEEAVRGNPAAEEHARAFRSGMTGGFVAILLGAAGLISGVVVAADSAPRSGGSGSGNSGEAALGGGLLIGGLAAYVTGFVLMVNAQPHMLDAINVYNDGPLSAGPLPKNSWRPPPVLLKPPASESAEPPVPAAPAAPPMPAGTSTPSLTPATPATPAPLPTPAPPN